MTSATDMILPFVLLSYEEVRLTRLRWHFPTEFLLGVHTMDDLQGCQLRNRRAIVCADSVLRFRHLFGRALEPVTLALCRRLGCEQ